MCPGTQKQIDPIKNIPFGIEKHIEDVKQDEKHVPELLESVMRPTFFVKEGLRPLWIKISQFGSKIPKSNFQLLGFRKSDGSPLEANNTSEPSKF